MDDEPGNGPRAPMTRPILFVQMSSQRAQSYDFFRK